MKKENIYIYRTSIKPLILINLLLIILIIITQIFNDLNLSLSIAIILLAFNLISFAQMIHINKDGIIFRFFLIYKRSLTWSDIWKITSKEGSLFRFYSKNPLKKDIVIYTRYFGNKDSTELASAIIQYANEEVYIDGQVEAIAQGIF
jgi:hypothetical protein